MIPMHPSRRRLMLWILTFGLFTLSDAGGTAAEGVSSAGANRRTLEAFHGKTPKLDGVISPGEWSDATMFSGVLDWSHTFTPTRDPKDLALTGYVKHDGKRLYFAFDVTDDVLYGIDTPRWLPKENPKAHELTRDGYPWFGDEMEVLINATNQWKGDENAAGNGSSWQMVCNLTKSRLGGIGRGGLLEGEPRSDPAAWETYQRWILTGAQECVAKVKPGGKGYIIEWAVSFNPCLEVEPGRFYSTAMGDRAMGLNIALGDLDEKEKGQGNFGNFHHEDWFSGDPKRRTQLKEWGTLWIRTGRKPASAAASSSSSPAGTR
jgi:solute:Na+ symporter, SSS family